LTSEESWKRESEETEERLCVYYYLPLLGYRVYCLLY